MSKGRKDDQLVKYKDTELYSTIYLITIKKEKDVLKEYNKKSIRKI